MQIIILGGTNNDEGELNNDTKNRIIKCYEILSNVINEKCKVNFSGGFNKKFNSTDISHSEICYNFFKKINKNNYNVEIIKHTENNNTVDEAVNFSEYLKYCNEKIKIITNDWHINRVEYLFSKVFKFYHIKNYEIISADSEYNENILQEERKKLQQLKFSPYGKWKICLDDHENIMNGQLISSKLFIDLKNKIETNHYKPEFSIINIGNNPASKIYMNIKKKKSEELGIVCNLINLDENTSQSEVLNLISELNNNENIDGIIVQLPLPTNFDQNLILESVDVNKDIDGFNTKNIGKLITPNINFIPATCQGILKLLDEYNIEVTGKNVVIIGKSFIVGTPLGLILSNETKYGATVTSCDKNTINLEHYVKNADILVVATGKHHLINKSMVVKDDCVMIDVGINQIKDVNSKKGYKIEGDVDFNYFKNKCKYITPVPGGIGPMTVYSLLENVYKSFINRRKL